MEKLLSQNSFVCTLLWSTGFWITSPVFKWRAFSYCLKSHHHSHSLLIYYLNGRWGWACTFLWFFTRYCRCSILHSDSLQMCFLRLHVYGVYVGQQNDKLDRGKAVIQLQISSTYFLMSLRSHVVILWWSSPKMCMDQHFVTSWMCVLVWALFKIFRSWSRSTYSLYFTSQRSLPLLGTTWLNFKPFRPY